MDAEGLNEGIGCVPMKVGFVPMDGTCRCGGRKGSAVCRWDRIDGAKIDSAKRASEHETRGPIRLHEDRIDAS